MKQSVAVAHKFVKTIPDKLEQLTVYVSMDYATAVHTCCCGCGREVRDTAESHGLDADL